MKRDMKVTAVVAAYVCWRKHGQRNSRTGGVPADSYYSLWTSFVKNKRTLACEIEDLVETHLCKLCGILPSRVPRVLRDLINNASPYRGEQNLTAVRLSECTNTKHLVCGYGYACDLIYIGWTYNINNSSMRKGDKITLLWNKKNVSCEIEDFVETHVCKLCGILRSRVLRVLCDLIKDVSPSWGEQNLTAVELIKCTNTKHLYWVDIMYY